MNDISGDHSKIPSRDVVGPSADIKIAFSGDEIIDFQMIVEMLFGSLPLPLCEASFPPKGNPAVLEIKLQMPRVLSFFYLCCRF